MNNILNISEAVFTSATPLADSVEEEKTSIKTTINYACNLWQSRHNCVVKLNKMCAAEAYVPALLSLVLLTFNTQFVNFIKLYDEQRKHTMNIYSFMRIHTETGNVYNP